MKIVKIFSASELVQALLESKVLKPGQYGVQANADLVKTLVITEEKLEEEQVSGKKKSK